MDKLLNWSLAQSDPEARKKAGSPDPELLAKLFGAAVDDATLMKQAMIVIDNPDATNDAKLTAWDNFEMLIENMDNANNIENLKLWPCVIKQLNDECSVEFRNYAASVIGTAVQNNEKSQKDFLKYENGMRLLIQMVSSECKLKAIYALSSVLRNNFDALEMFNKFNGFENLESLIEESKTNSKLALRVLSLLNSLVSLASEDEKVLKNLNEHKFLNVLNIKVKGNLTVVDKIIFFIKNLKSCGYEFKKDEMSLVLEFAKDVETHHAADVSSRDLQILKKL